MRQLFVVDDDREVVDLLVMILQQEGYKAVGFTSGEEALEAAFQNPPLVMFVDLLMPRCDGITVCRRIKTDERTKDVRVVFLSGHGYLEREASAAGADDYLSKPFDLDDVLRRVAKIAEHARTVISG